MLQPSEYPPPNMSWKSIASLLSKVEQDELLKTISTPEVPHLNQDFWLNARREQLPPEGNWLIWIIMAGRGFGKTYAGANWLIEGHLNGTLINSGIVAATATDLRRYCIDGPSGVIAQAPEYFKPKHVPSKVKLEWPNGTITDLFSSEKPARIRGPNLDGVWCDELSWWMRVEECWDNLDFSLRFGKNPQRVITMTPRPIKLVRQIIKEDDVVITRGVTSDNAANLAASFLQRIQKKHGGTRLGRQELSGELLEDAEGALWKMDQLDQIRTYDDPPKLTRTVVALDPSASSGEDADEAGIVVSGKDKQNRGHVIADHSLRGTPNEWGRKAIWAYHEYNANIIVAEKNQGGEMITEVLNNIDKSVPVKLVHASQGKVARAEPVSILYEKYQIDHHGLFRELEDEMVNFVPNDVTESPNRVDALVWGLTELFIKARPKAGSWGRKRDKERATAKTQATTLRNLPGPRTRTYKIRSY